MLPHTGLFLLGKVALQMRIRRRLKKKRHHVFYTFRRPFKHKEGKRDEHSRYRRHRFYRLAHRCFFAEKRSSSRDFG
ncbi:hypothetical protein GWC84_08395 [Neisseria meningitidis]|nr:hypothetical protein [Neisseria meningitidis]